MTNLQDVVLSDPALLAALALLVRGAVAYQTSLTYPEFIAAHRLKCRVFQLLDPIATRLGRPLVHTKEYREEDEEFDRTVPEGPKMVASRIGDVFDGHLVATAKARMTPNGIQFAHSQWRQVHGDGTQTEVFLFRNPDGSTDVYVHHETAVEDPEGHLTDHQGQGDVRGAFASAYEDHPDTVDRLSAPVTPEELGRPAKLCSHAS